MAYSTDLTNSCPNYHERRYKHTATSFNGAQLGRSHFPQMDFILRFSSPNLQLERYFHMTIFTDALQHTPRDPRLNAVQLDGLTITGYHASKETTDELSPVHRRPFTHF